MCILVKEYSCLVGSFQTAPKLSRNGEMISHGFVIYPLQSSLVSYRQKLSQRQLYSSKLTFHIQILYLCVSRLSNILLVWCLF